MTAVDSAEVAAAGHQQTAGGSGGQSAEKWDPRSVQDKWLSIWDTMDLFEGSDDADDTRPRTYVLDMFPYPSGDLHMGHAEAYAVADAMARYYFERGHNVLHPIGWDAFGLPAENAAIRGDTHPADWTYANIEKQAASFRRYALSFDWTRRLQTCDPEYYRWTQWLFLRLYERGLAYRGDGYVNWCPRDQTVLANEQVINGHCERCGCEVVRRLLTQWYFKITEYADRLLEDMKPLEGAWPERVRWPGRAGDGVHDQAGHAVRRDILRGRRRLTAGRRAVRARPAGGTGRLPDSGRQADGHRAPVSGPPEDRRLPGQARDQPGERRADRCLGRRLRAARLRHWRDHGRARARPARPGLRSGLRPARAGRRADRPA